MAGHHKKAMSEILAKGNTAQVKPFSVANLVDKNMNTMMTL